MASSAIADSLLYALEKLQMSHIDLKPEQRSAMEAMLDRRDTFVWLPTGYGKSLCYQALPFMFDHRQGFVNTGTSCAALVISPLLALMVDQVTSLRLRSVKCSIVTSSSGGIDSDLLATEGSLVSDSLLFCTPEALVRSKWRNSIENTTVSKRIVALVIDEAHCVSKW